MKKIVTHNGKKGGWLKGKPHYDKNGKSLGGIKAIVTDTDRPVELEGGEVIINKEASAKHWKELSRINQSAGNGVAIGPPGGADEDPEEYKEGGKVIEFNPNHIPNKWILQYAENIKKNHTEIWKLGGNIFGNQAFLNLQRVVKRGHWLDSEEWMYIKWRSYVARHKHDFRIEGVVAMLKWVDKVDKGWPYMKQLIEERIDKIKEKKERKGWTHKMKSGGRTIAQTPAPKKERIYGSKVNKPESAASESNAKSIKLSDSFIESIKNKIRGTGISLATAKAVVRRGMGAYSSSHRPTIKGGKPNKRVAWGLARLNAFLYKAKHGKSKSGNYVQDDDLLREAGFKVSKMGNGGKVNELNIIIKNIGDHSKKYSGAYKKIFDIIEENIAFYNAYGTSYEEIKGNDFYITITPYPEQFIIDKISKLKNVEIVEGFEKGGEMAQEYYTRTYADGTEQKISINDYEKNVLPNLGKGGSTLLAPNGKLSKLTPEQYRLVRTPEFKAWFGDWENDPKNASKVVDENGEPLVCYHGTKKTFTKFYEKKYIGSEWDALNFFTTNYLTAVGDYDGWITYPCFIKIINPLLELKGTPETSIGLEIIAGRKTDGFIFSYSALQKPAYDRETWVAVPKSNQIKLADKPIIKPSIKNKKFIEKVNATFDKTNTTFDGSNPDIRYAGGGEVEFTPEKKGTLTRGNEIIKYFEKVNGNYRLLFYTLNESKGKVPTMCDAFGYCKKLNPRDVTPQELIKLIEENQLMETGGELKKGIKTEQEHRKTLEGIASGKYSVDQAIKMTAKDHLKEDPKYYTKLINMESKMAKGGEITVKGVTIKVGDEVYLRAKGGQTRTVKITNISDKRVTLQEGSKAKENPPIDRFERTFVNLATADKTSTKTPTPTPVQTSSKSAKTSTTDPNEKKLTYSIGDYFQIDGVGWEWAKITDIRGKSLDAVDNNGRRYSFTLSSFKNYLDKNELRFISDPTKKSTEETQSKVSSKELKMGDYFRIDTWGTTEWAKVTSIDENFVFYLTSWGSQSDVIELETANKWIKTGELIFISEPKQEVTWGGLKVNGIFYPKSGSKNSPYILWAVTESKYFIQPIATTKEQRLLVELDKSDIDTTGAAVWEIILPEGFKVGMKFVGSPKSTLDNQILEIAAVYNKSQEVVYHSDGISYPGNFKSLVEDILDGTIIPFENAVPSTDPSTWDAKFKVGDKVKIRIDMSMNVNIPYDSPSNQFTIDKIDTAGAFPFEKGGFQRIENPSGLLYVLNNKGGQWEGKDLELVEPSKVKPQQPVKPSAPIGSPAPKLSIADKPLERLKEWKEYNMIESVTMTEDELAKKTLADFAIALSIPTNTIARDNSKYILDILNEK